MDYDLNNEDQLSFDDQEVINISHPRLKNILESLLFVTKKPVTIDEIRKVLRIDRGLIERTLHELIAEYSGKGIIVSKIAGGFQMVTNPDNAKFVDKLLKSPIEATLSQAALEALTIVAYKQPVTRLEIDNIRGVVSDGVLQTLTERRLIAEVGRGSGVGRPRLYGTTIEFLRHFGLKELADLPAFPHDELGHDVYKTILPEERVNVSQDSSANQPVNEVSETTEDEASEPPVAETKEPQALEAGESQTVEVQQPQSLEPQQNLQNEQ